MEKKGERVLVTGASGFVAGHVIHGLLTQGYLVRGTVRSIANKAKVEPIYQICPDKRDNLELVEADLLDEKAWAAACDGCDYVMHVASPFPSSVPDDENELIKPAVKGTLAVLNAALSKGVKKVVVTSSTAAIMNPALPERILTEDDWTDPNVVPPYEKSKYHAEKAVWHFYEQAKGKMAITCINPGFIVGPTFLNTPFTSAEFFIDGLNGKLPAIPDLTFGVVDVRDVADAHLAAMQRPETDGQRYILVGKNVTGVELVGAMRNEFSKYGYSFPSIKLGYCPLRLASIFDAKIKLILPYVGKRMILKNDKSIKELGIKYRNADQSIIEMGHSLIDRKFVEDKRKKK